MHSLRRHNSSVEGTSRLNQQSDNVIIHRELRFEYLIKLFSADAWYGAIISQSFAVYCLWRRRRRCRLV